MVNLVYCYTAEDLTMVEWAGCRLQTGNVFRFAVCISVMYTVWFIQKYL